MPLQSCSSNGSTGNSNLTLTSSNQCSTSTTNATFVGQLPTVQAAYVGNLAKVFRPTPDNECRTLYICDKKCECEQISVIEPTAMDLVEKTTDSFEFKFTKLGEINMGVQFIARRPAFVAVASTKATASANYVFMDGTSVNEAGQTILLPELELGAPDALVEVCEAWMGFAKVNGYGVSTIPKANYPAVAKDYKYGFEFKAGSSILGRMASFTNHLLGNFVHDVHMYNPAQKALNLMKKADDHLLETLTGAQMTQPLTLPLFKTRCNALANRAALFQQLVVSVTPPTMRTYTCNDLVLTSNKWAQRSNLTEKLSSDIVVSQELLESVIHVGSQFGSLDASVKRALLKAYAANEVEALAVVLSTISLVPVEDAGEEVQFGNIEKDESTSLSVDGVAHSLDDVTEIGTLLFGNKGILLNAKFLEFVLKNIGHHLSEATEVIFEHKGLKYDLLEFSYFPNPSLAPHMADVEVEMYGLNEEDGALNIIYGDSRWELMDTLSEGISAVGVEAFIGSPEVIAAIEAPKEEIISEVNCSSITLGKNDLNASGVASINYTATKPVAWMVLVATCEFLHLDVYKSASNPAAVEGIQFTTADRPTLFETPRYPNSHLVAHKLSTSHQARRRMELGDKFRTSAMGAEQDIVRQHTLKLNGVEMNDTGLPYYNPQSVGTNFNSHAIDFAHSATFEIKGVYLITFMSNPFGTSNENYDHNCFSNFLNTVRIESVELVLKFNPRFFERFPSVLVQIDVFVMNSNIMRQMSGLMGNLLAADH